MKKFLSFLIVFLFLSLPLIQAVSYSYDANGNRISGDGFFRVYDASNHLRNIYTGSSLVNSNLIVNYTWHATEERIAMKYVYFNGTLNETVFYPREDWVRVKNSSGTFDFFYAIENGNIVGMQDFNAKKFIIINDHKGSAYAVLDSTGKQIELTFYDPYGGIISGGTLTRFDYEGKENDPTTGDIDFSARTLDTLGGGGMFIQPDTIIQNVYDPQSLNHYSFERNDPYNNKDPSGHCLEDGCVIEATATVGAIIGLSTYFLTQDHYTLKGALSYTAAGALSAAALPLTIAGLGISSSAAVAIGAGIVGSGASRVITNFGDERPLTEGIGFSALAGGLTSGISEEVLPTTSEYKIKYYPSFFTTETGQNYLNNVVGTETLSNFINSVQSQSSHSKQDSGKVVTTNTGVRLRASSGFQNKLKEANLL